jgi:hypothetical protein
MVRRKIIGLVGDNYGTYALYIDNNIICRTYSIHSVPVKGNISNLLDAYVWIAEDGEVSIVESDWRGL